MTCQGGVKKNIDPHLRKGKHGWEKNVLRWSVQNQRTKPRSDAAAGDWTQGQREHWAKRPVPGALSTQLFPQVIKAFKAQAVCAKIHQRDGNRGSNYLGFFMITPGVTMLIIESNSKHEVLFRLPFLIWSNHFSCDALLGNSVALLWGGQGHIQRPTWRGVSTPQAFLHPSWPLTLAFQTECAQWEWILQPSGRLPRLMLCTEHPNLALHWALGLQIYENNKLLLLF